MHFLNKTCASEKIFGVANAGFPSFWKECSYENFGKLKWHEVTCIPCFTEVRILQLHFKERPTLVLVFTDRKKFEKDFCFYEKGCYHTNVGLSLKYSGVMQTFKKWGIPVMKSMTKHSKYKTITK